MMANHCIQFVWLLQMKGYNNHETTSSEYPRIVKIFLIVSALAGIANFGVSMWQVTYRDDGLADYFIIDSWQVDKPGKLHGIL